MSALLDDISRITASSISRREAFKLVGGAVGGALLASLGLGRASRGLGVPAGGAQAPEFIKCPSGEFRCGATCCKNGLTCCNGKCCASGQTCCGTTCCDRRQCCREICCTSGERCIDGRCCPSAQACFGRCCPSGQTCCNAFLCCPSGQCCNHGQRCCPPSEACCNNRCVKRAPSGSSPCVG